MQPDTINKLVTALVARAGLTWRVTPHMARHAFASNIDAGGSLDDVRQLRDQASVL
jgi:integrase/recombinase XerD